jgi:hypothetical protein
VNRVWVRGRCDRVRTRRTQRSDVSATQRSSWGQDAPFALRGDGAVCLIERDREKVGGAETSALGVADVGSLGGAAQSSMLLESIL